MSCRVRLPDEDDCRMQHWRVAACVVYQVVWHYIITRLASSGSSIMAMLTAGMKPRGVPCGLLHVQFTLCWKEIPCRPLRDISAKEMPSFIHPYTSNRCSHSRTSGMSTSPILHFDQSSSYPCSTSGHGPTGVIIFGLMSK